MQSLPPASRGVAVFEVNDNDLNETQTAVTSVFEVARRVSLFRKEDKQATREKCISIKKPSRIPKQTVDFTKTN